MNPFPNYKIRAARMPDLQILAQIECAAATLFRDTSYAFLVDDLPLSLDFVTQQFAAGRVWVAVDDRDTPIGYAIAQDLDGNAYLRQIDVHPAYGRRGIGRQLVECVCVWARERDYCRIFLSTFADINWNAPFYAKLGFRILAEAELSPSLQQLRAKEAQAGLPIDRRVIMCRDLPRDAARPNSIGSLVTIHLRMATIDDLDLLRHWDEEPHVVASDPNDDWGWEVELTRNPEWRAQLIAEVEGRPIGFMQIIDPAWEDSHYWGEIAPNLRAIDIWIGEEADLGKGYGTQMMRLAIDRCFADPLVTAILIDPLANNTRACCFYERLGFQFVEPRRFGADDCLVYRLERDNWQTLSRPK